MRIAAALTGLVAASAMLLGATGALADPPTDPPAEPSIESAPTPAVTPSAAPTSQPAPAGPSGEVTPAADPTPATTTSAEPRPINKQLLHRLRADEIQLTGTPQGVMDDAYDSCDRVRSGMSGPQAAEVIAAKRGLNTDDSNLFVMEAVIYLCRDRFEALTQQ